MKAKEKMMEMEISSRKKYSEIKKPAKSRFLILYSILNYDLLAIAALTEADNLL